MLILNVEDHLILSCIKLAPNRDELDQINGLIPLIQNWEYLITTIIDRGIGPLLYEKLPLLPNSSLIPEPIKKKLQQAYYITLTRSTILYDHFRKIVEAFSIHNIPVIALKGIYLSERLYQDIGLRQFSDIDLLVKEEDGEKCLAILVDNGYNQAVFKVSEFVRENTETIHYPPMVLNGVSVEIHTKLHKKTELYRLDVVELWKNALPVTINHTQIYTLNTIDLLIYLCVHLDTHFRSGKVQFTCFNDITNILDRFADLDWNVFTETCVLYKCEDTVYKYLVLVRKYINASVPESIIQKYSYLLTEKDEHLFLRILKVGKISYAFNMHTANIKKVKGQFNKLRYAFHIVYPPKAFMIQLYRIKHPFFVFLYYPYRHFIGIRETFFHIFRK